MTARSTKQAGAHPVTDLEREFLNDALTKVRTPEYRYWLAIGFEAVASAMALMESRSDLKIAKRPSRRRKRKQ